MNKEDRQIRALLQKADTTSREHEASLHARIMRQLPERSLRRIYLVIIFALLWGIAASFVIWWGIFLSVIFIGLFFIVLECCHAMALDEVPQIRQDFELMLRALERRDHKPFSEWY